MGLESEIEDLKRQNHRLKLALFGIIVVLLVSATIVVGFAGWTAVRARAQTLEALEREQAARVRAEKAFERAQRALEEVEVLNGE